MISPVNNVSVQAFASVNANTDVSANSYMTASVIRSSGGLTQKGMAFLALMALAQKDEEKLSNAQKLGLLALALGAADTTEITSFSLLGGGANNTGQILSIAGISPTVYTAAATAAINGISSAGMLFNATV